MYKARLFLSCETLCELFELCGLLDCLDCVFRVVSEGGCNARLFLSYETLCEVGLLVFLGSVSVLKNVRSVSLVSSILQGSQEDRMLYGNVVNCIYNCILKKCL